MLEEGKHYHRCLNELDCTFDLDAIEAERENEEVVEFLERNDLHGCPEHREG